jgi:serine/threonine protein phosphatase 1
MTHTIAIGDVHGCYNLLLDTVEKYIGSGNELVLLGDLFDRSPETDGDLNVLEFVRDMNEHPDAYGLSAVECLMGNHESLLLDALQGDVNCWLMNGGNVEFAVHLIENPSHIEWIKQRPTYVIRNNHLLVHAGVKPDIPLDNQTPFDMCWIRPDPYIPHNLPYTIIHGHTIHDEITHYPDRIAIDTGAFHTGNLSTYAI